jgi:multidrug efflux pump subunit AcrB
MLRRALLLSVAILSGCAGAGALFERGEDSPSPADGPLALDAEGLAVYLDPMRALAEGDPATQAEVFQSVADAASSAPTTTNRLRLALALATPGHPASDPVRAQRLLNELLAVDDALLPEERVLATIHLKDVEQRLILAAEAEHVQQQAAAELERQNNENNAKLDAAQRENRRLKSELEDAQQKLEAITSIERSIRQRDNEPVTP